MLDVKMGSLTETFDAKVFFSQLLELAADDNVEGLNQYIELNPNSIDEDALWYGRQIGARGMVLEYRTPLMIAAMYGNLDVMKTILCKSGVDVNHSCSSDKATALHCVAAGGSSNAVDAVKMLLVNGADPNLLDAERNRPYDVINVSCMLPQVRVSLENLLNSHGPVEQKDMHVSINGLNDESTSISILSETKSLPSDLVETPSSPMGLNFVGIDEHPVSEKKEYPIDPSLPDIKNSAYITDEFRMYSFKVRPCSRAYSHDWTECPFVHPGENARRRDPRKYHYSCVPCPDFRKGSCQRGDMCEYAHGVFECWLHPAQYRTRLCKDGISCNRRVCFFAHTPDELRPLYASTGSAVPSPRSVASAASVMDMAAILNIFPGSPAACGMPHSPFSPPMSPSANGMPHSPSSWQQPNIPTLHLPGSNVQPNSNMQASRLRSSLNARDILAEELNILQDREMGQRHVLNNHMSCFSQPQFNSAAGNLSSLSKVMVPSNLDERFSVEGSSPRFSPSHKSMAFSHFHQQQPSMLSPINTKVFSPKAAGDHHHHPFLQSSIGPSSPGIMSPRGGIDPQSPLNARLSALALREKHQQMRSLSARDLGSSLPRDWMAESGGGPGSPVGSWPMWETTNGRPDWLMNSCDELNRSKHLHATMGNGFEEEEPDLSWVQSLVKDSPSDNNNKEMPNNGISGTKPCGDGSNSKSDVESLEHSEMGAWLDQVAAQ